MNGIENWRVLFPKFPTDRVALALELLLESAEGLKKKHHSEREDPVTQRLRLRVRLNPRFKKSDLDLLCQHEVYDPMDRDSKLRGRLDLSFLLLNAPKPVPYFAIEAKRLRYHSPNGDFKTGNSEYVTGTQGMRCFTEDRYAEGLDSGAMLGYVYDGCIDTSKDGISQLIGKHAKLLKCLEPYNLAASDIPFPDSGVEVTNHALKDRVFRIFHILLSV